MWVVLMWQVLRRQVKWSDKEKYYDKCEEKFRDMWCVLGLAFGL